MRTENIEKGIYLTAQDLERLILLLDFHILRNNDQAGHIDKLIDALDRAHIIDEALVPDDLVIIDSRVWVADLDSRKRLTFDLISNDAADPDDGKIWVLAPMGIAVLGCRAGDIVELGVPRRNKRLKIEGVLHKKQGP